MKDTIIMRDIWKFGRWLFIGVLPAKRIWNGIVMKKRPTGGKGWFFATAPAVICCVVFSSALLAQDDDDELRVARQHSQTATGPRTANCLIKVRGVEYFHGFCTFTPGGEKESGYIPFRRRKQPLPLMWGRTTR